MRFAAVRVGVRVAVALVGADDVVRVVFGVADDWFRLVLTVGVLLRLAGRCFVGVVVVVVYEYGVGIIHQIDATHLVCSLARSIDLLRLHLHFTAHYDSTAPPA